MYSKQNTNKRKQSKASRSIYTAHSERFDVEIHKHFSTSVKSREEINTGVDSFPIIGDVESSNVEVSVNIDKPNKTTKKSFFVNNPTEISLDVVFPDEIETNIDFFNSDYNNSNFNNNAKQIETCTSLNKKVEDINKQLADLEKDIQYNFYDPKTKVGSNLKKYSSQLQSFSSSKNVSNTTSTASEYGNFSKFDNNPPKQNDPSIELKNEIFNYRSSLKQKDFEEKIERRLEKLHKQKEQSELRKNYETKGESGHEPTCPFSLKLDLPEPVLKIHEMQLAAKRIKNAESGAFNINTQNAAFSQTSRQKFDQTTIQNKNQEPSTSKSKSPISTDRENSVQVSISSVNVGVVQQLDSLLTKSTNELDELKSLLKEYLESEKARPPSARNNTQIRKDETKKKMKLKVNPSHSSSSGASLTSLSAKGKKKEARGPEACQKIEKKSRVIKIKQVSKSKKTTKCGLSDISESNEMEPKSSSSDNIKSKAITPFRKQSRPPSSKKNARITSDQQAELTVNIISKSDSFLSSSEEEQRLHVRNYINKQPKDSNDLMNPPNTARLDTSRTKESQSPKENIDKKTNGLSVQILPPLDIRRSLATQKLPVVAIEAIDGSELTNQMSSENVKYIQIKHPENSDKELPKKVQGVKALVDASKNTCQNACKIPTETSLAESTARDTIIKEIYIAPQPILSSSSETSSEIIQIVCGQLPEKKGTVCEELNLDIECLPSVRTLKEIQSYLEQKCSMIRTRLQEESKLKTGETLSLRYKLSEPPLWQRCKPESGNQTIVLEEKPKATILSPLKSYAAVKAPLSPLSQKHDNFQQVRYNPSLIANKNPVDKSLQTSFADKANVVSPIARQDRAITSPQLSSQTSKKNLEERKEFKTPPPLKLPETNKPHENTTSIREITISTQGEDIKVPCVPPCNTPKTDIANLQNENTIRPLVCTENQVTSKPLTDIKKNSNISTQIKELEPRKCVSFEIVTSQFSVIPKENKGTQVSPINTDDKMTKKVVGAERKAKDEKTQTAKAHNETVVKRYLLSSATQTTDAKDAQTACNKPETEKVEMKVTAGGSKDTRDCCTQYSPIQQQQQQQQLQLDATEYKQINSFRKAVGTENEEQNTKHVHYPAEEPRHYYKSKMKNKRPAVLKHKVCSTPVPSSSSSISAAESVSFSDGEVKLPCECSTSIGEIHLCRFANDIRKKVRILKQHPEKVLRESFGAGNYKMTREHKYNDNWYAYYVTKTATSSENGTGSNLSSIKSNIDTE